MMSTTFHIDSDTALAIDGPPPCTDCTNLQLYRMEYVGDEEGQERATYQLEVPQELKEQFIALMRQLDALNQRIIHRSEWIAIGGKGYGKPPYMNRDQGDKDEAKAALNHDHAF